MHYDFKLIEGIKTAKNMTPEQRENLLKEADRKIPNPNFSVYDFLVNLGEDKDFCIEMGLELPNETNIRIIKTGLAYSLMYYA